MGKSIEQLCKELENKLRAITHLDYFYIGETDNLSETADRHMKEGYSSTTLLAKGNHSIISKAEEQLITYFQDSNLKEKNKNKSPYSVGSKTADMIYVSIKISPRVDNELDDDDIIWPQVYEL